MQASKKFTDLIVWQKAHHFTLMVISQGSLEECKYYIILARDLEYLEENEQFMNLAEEIGKLLDAYLKAILASVS